MTVMTIEMKDHVALLTLRRPQVMNALNYELYMALEDAVRDSEARVIVITGEGRAVRAARALLRRAGLGSAGAGSGARAGGGNAVHGGYH